MNILVTGSEGFIGRPTMNALNVKGNLSKGVDSKGGINIVNYDHLKSTVVAVMPKIDVIIHTAANCSTQKALDYPRADFYNNAVGTLHIAELARETGAKILYLSSCKVQGGDDGSLTPYGLSKKAGEDILREWSMTYGVDYIINRLGTVYGPGQEGSPESGWIGWFTKVAKEKLPLEVYGNGYQERDLLYIDDLVELLVKQVNNFDKYKGKIFSVGGGKENLVSLNDMIKLMDIKDVTNKPVRKGDARRYVADNKGLNWKPKTDYKVGIKKTMEAK